MSHLARPLRIGIVAYEMEGTATGVGRYLEGLLEGLVALDEPLLLRLFFKGDRFEHRLWTTPEPGAVRIETVFDGRPSGRPIVWEQLRLPSLLHRQPLDLLFSPSYSLPPRLPMPGIVTLHDLSFEHLPDAFARRERWRRRYLARRAAHRATRVLADSERIAAELIAAYHLDPDRVAVVPLAVGRHFNAHARVEDPEHLATLGIGRPYLLALGTVLKRRRLDLVLEAFGRVAREDPDLGLVIAGNNRLLRPKDLDHWIDDCPAHDRVMRLDWVAESALPALFRQARAAIYLSTYEGFGLPPLEALACGTPCVVSEGLGLDELWADYPLRVKAWTPEAVAAVLDQALGTIGERLATEGPARMARLDWRHTARCFLDVVHALGTEFAAQHEEQP